MIAFSPSLNGLPPHTRRFYRHAVQLLNEAEIPFLIGGAYALAHHAGIVRHTKDLDVFLLREHCPMALEALSRAGYTTELTFAHWLAKARRGEDFVDLIFSSGNGIARVDELWFEHAEPCRFIGEPVRLCPPEEMIWSKSFICERERFDGADIHHLILAYGERMDWKRLLRRMGPFWRVLLSHLILFGFAYPAEKRCVPAWVMDELIARLKEENGEPAPDQRHCHGTLLSRSQYLTAIEGWGYVDGRQRPEVDMTPEQIQAWTDAGREQT